MIINGERQLMTKGKVYRTHFSISDDRTGRGNKPKEECQLPMQDNLLLPYCHASTKDFFMAMHKSNTAKYYNNMLAP